MSRAARLGALLALLSLAGCSLLVDFDRSRIPEDDAGASDASDADDAGDGGEDEG